LTIEKQCEASIFYLLSSRFKAEAKAEAKAKAKKNGAKLFTGYSIMLILKILKFCLKIRGKK
jgi:hypothetical protein